MRVRCTPPAAGGAGGIPVRREHRGLVRRAATDRGAASVEMVLAMPMIMLAILAAIQVSLWLYADHAARIVATQSLDATRIQGGSVQAGQSAADTYITQVGHGSLRHPQVIIRRTSTTATVEVRAQAPSVLPFIHMTVHSRQQAPVERYTEDTVGLANVGGTP
jgi:Flp pilus assembly protein TadG